MKKLMVIFALLSAVVLSGCGTKVEVPPAHVGKVMGKNGYLDGTIATSKFRLDPCMAYCDRLVVLSVQDFSVKEGMPLSMPKDKLEMKFDVRLTLAVAPNKHEDLFNKIAPTSIEDFISKIDINTAYTTYAQQVIRTEAREYLSQFSISEVASNRDVINSKLAERLTKIVSERTPFIVRYAGLADVAYPELITSAQEKAAERREAIQQEEAQLEISKVQLERQLKEQQMQRAIDVERANAEAQVNRILASSMTPAYLEYRRLDVMEKIAAPPNKVFVPTQMLDSMAGQVMLGSSK